MNRSTKLIPVPKSILVPRDAYRYWPSGEDAIKGSGKKLIRFVFEFQNLTEFEKTKLDRLLKEIKNGKIEGYEVPKSWSSNHLMRFCYGTDWKTRKAVQALVIHLQWRQGILSQGYGMLYPKVFQLLSEGIFYIHGRDYKFRPLLIINFTKIDFKQHSIDDYTSLLCFILEYILDKMLLPGQVENLVVLTDLAKQGLGNMSLSSLKQVLQILQCNYRCRLGANFIINPPKSIWMLWSCIKPFLDDMTIDKIKINKSSYSAEMLALFNPYQVEERYGGKAPNLEVFWPPVVPETGFSAEGKHIVLSNNDSYSKYNHVEVVIEEEEEGKSKNRASMKVAKVNSHNVSFASSEAVEVADVDEDPYARSDIEDQEENLIDFELVSPFTRKMQRNPTFLSIGKMSSSEFQKQISFKLMSAGKKEKSNESLESSVDFEPDPSGKIYISETDAEKLVEVEMAKDEGLVVENGQNFCSCQKIDCAILKNSCVAF